MKRFTHCFLKICICLLILGNIAYSQTNTATNGKPQAPYEKINLKFEIGNESPDEDVGFNNPKSFWKFSYELRFIADRSDFKNTSSWSSYNRSDLTPAERAKLSAQEKKSYEKAWKKVSVLVARGKVPKSLLSTSKNREIIIPVDLTPEIKNVLAAATDTWANPEFRITLKGTITTQTAAGNKFKNKPIHGFSCVTKHQTKESQTWLMNTCGMYIGLKSINNKIMASRSALLQN